MSGSPEPEPTGQVPPAQPPGPQVELPGELPGPPGAPKPFGIKF